MRLYNLWDTDTGNYFGQYTDEEEVLKVVRTLVDHYGADYAECLGLGRVNEDGSFADPVSGAALIARVAEVAAERERVVPRPAEVLAPRR